MDSVLLICADASTDTFLRELAIRLHQHEAVIESPVKREVIAELLKVVLSKITTAPPSKPSGYKLTDDSAKAMLETCLDADCGEVGDLIVKTWTDSLQATQGDSKRVFSMLWSLRTRLNESSNLPAYITHLQRTAHNLYCPSFISMAYIPFYPQINSEFVEFSLILPGGISNFLSR